MSAVTVDLPKVAHCDLDRRPVFTSFLFEVTAYAATPMVELWLPERGVDSLFMDAVEARSLAAALLAAADASEATT